MTPKARAQEALDDMDKHKLKSSEWLSKHDETIRESLALSAAIERIPKIHRPDLFWDGTAWIMALVHPDSDILSDEPYWIACRGDTPLQAILAALEALEKHAAAVKRGEG